MGFNESITVKALGILKAYSSFRNTYNFLKSSQHWKTDELEKYQLERLSDLLEHSYDNVPYYRQIFNEQDLRPSDIHDFKSLSLLPLLTKDKIRKNSKKLIATNFPDSKLEYVTTGGSTGDPMGFYYEKGVSRAQEWAFIKTLWDRVGYKFRDKCVILRGNVVKNADKCNFWEKTFFNRWLVLSSYHMNDDNLEEYVEKIREFNPKFIQAYPSNITLLAKFMDKNGFDPFKNLKAVLCGSENIYTWQKELVERTLGCRVYSWYGHSERSILAGECELSSNYHIFPEYGIFELIDEKGNVTNNDRGVIVSTSLTNYAMPFIRYKTEDVGIINEDKCACGRNYPILQTIEGRSQDYVLTKNGNLVSLTALIFSQHFESFSEIKQLQMIQKEKGKVIVIIIPEKGYSNKNEDEILSKLKNVVGKELEIHFEYVNHIDRTTSGKHKFLIQELELNKIG